MSSEVSEVLKTLGEKFGLFVDWSQQNVQPYIEDLMQRVVQYNLAINICWLVVSTILFVIGTIFISRIIKRVRSADGIPIDEESIAVATAILSIFGILIGITMIPISIGHIFQCLYLPEIVFIEELKSLIK